MTLLRRLGMHILIAFILGLAPGYLVHQSGNLPVANATLITTMVGYSIAGLLLTMVFVLLANLGARLFSKSPLKGAPIWFWLLWAVFTAMSYLGNMQPVTA